MSKPKIHSGYMECAIAELIGWRTHTIVPNVSWGLGLNHECDMLVLDTDGRFTEIEIKITISDLKAESKKKHNHSSKIITRLIYAVPEEILETAKSLINEKYGIISVKYDVILERFVASWVRRSKHYRIDNYLYKKPDGEIINKFYQLGCMRIWTLKKLLYK